MQLMSEEIMMEKRMTTNTHSRDSRGSERGHKRKLKEYAKANGMRNKLTDEEYWKEVAEIWEKFNKF